jgi:hypothetical protein
VSRDGKKREEKKKPGVKPSWEIYGPSRGPSQFCSSSGRTTKVQMESACLRMQSLAIGQYLYRKSAVIYRVSAFFHPPAIVDRFVISNLHTGRWIGDVIRTRTLDLLDKERPF